MKLVVNQGHEADGLLLGGGFGYKISDISRRGRNSTDVEGRHELGVGIKEVIVCCVKEVLSKGCRRRRRLGGWCKHSGCHGQGVGGCATW